MGGFKSKILVCTLLNAEIPAAVFKPSPGVFAGAEKGFPSSQHQGLGILALLPPKRRLLYPAKYCIYSRAENSLCRMFL